MPAYLSALDILQLREVFRKYPEIEKVVMVDSPAQKCSSTRVDLAITTRYPEEDIKDLTRELDRLPIKIKFDVIFSAEIRNGLLRQHLEKNGFTLYP